MNNSSSRLQVVDALRGFAIVAILLLHNIEHFDFYYMAENIPDWMLPIDKAINDSLFFLFSGKAYAIFALLFGLTFYIQDTNQLNRGADFRGRFAWRMLLLLGFGMLNSVFYEGDILAFYAVLGLFLIPVARLNTKVVVIIALVLLLQPVEWIKLIQGIQNPDVELGDPVSWAYFGKSYEYVPGSNALNTWWGNLTNGRLAVILWSWEKGRYFQTISLFMFGMLIGRSQLFAETNKSKKAWKHILILSSIVSALYFFMSMYFKAQIEESSIRRPLLTIVDSIYNFSFMLLLVSSFTLIFWSIRGRKSLGIFSPLGKMSLSNYMMQSIVGATIYHGYGLGLYKYTGATYSLLIGLILAVSLGLFSRYWMNRHKRGPLETIWHKLTWVNTDK